jgi:hypothetical protein
VTLGLGLWGSDFGTVTLGLGLSEHFLGALSSPGPRRPLQKSPDMTQSGWLGTLG